MKKSNEFENILDRCLERLVRGETVEQCLKSYPEQALELEPLLRTAQAAREASAILPRADFKARARYEFRAALHDKASRKKQPRFALRRGWAVALLVVSILLVSGGGTALAASSSMPDSRLYPVKLATEQVQLTLTPSDIDKAQLCAVFADRRVTEIIYLAVKGDAQQVEAVTQHLDEGLATLVTLVSTESVEAATVGGAPKVLTEEPAVAPSPASAPQPETVPVSPPSPSERSEPVPPPSDGEDTEDAPIEDGNRANLKAKVASDAVSHLDALQSVLELAPVSLKPALNRAITVSQNGYRKALAAMD